MTKTDAIGKQLQAEFKKLNDRLERIEKHQLKIDDRISGIDVDMTRDRKDFDDILIQTKTNTESISALSTQITRLQGKTVEAVTNSVNETTEPLREEIKELNRKPVINVTEKQAKNISWIRKCYTLITKWRTNK